ncbi:MAG: hypothetical protein QXL85_04585 [Candidatus Bathyarchaeia archaeon]
MEETISAGKKSRKALYAVMAIVIVGLGAFLYYWFFVRPQAPPWLFKGAYAKYHGETTILFVTVKMDMRLEVVDYNATHAKMLMYVKMETPLGLREFQNITWSDLSKKSYEFEGYNLKRTYEQEVYIEGIGTRMCIIYEYEPKTAYGTLMTVYVDKTVKWPIKIKFSSEVTQTIPLISFELTLTESNIPGLKE